jgi:hypothetical protein
MKKILLITWISLIFGLLLFGAVCLGLYFDVGLIWLAAILIGLTLGGFFLAPLLLDWELAAFRSLRWIESQEIPSPLKTSLEKCFNQEGISIPRIGVISDDSSHIQSYGVFRSKARLVISEGFLKDYSAEEREALILREVWNISSGLNSILSFLGIVPALIVLLNSFFRELKERVVNQESNTLKELETIFAKTEWPFNLLWLASSIAMLVILKISCYLADEYAVKKQTTGVNLVSALIKFGFGLRRQDRISTATLFFPVTKPPEEIAFDGKIINSEYFIWERGTIWALIHNFFGIKPMLFWRFKRITKISEVQMDEPIIKLHYSTFVRDFIWLIFLVMVFLGVSSIGIFGDYFGKGPDWVESITLGVFNVLFAFILTAILFVTKHFAGIRSNLDRSQVKDLFRILSVSYFSPVFVKITGEVRGRTEAGDIFDPNFFLTDESGKIKIRITETGSTLFYQAGIEKFLNQTVTVKGWLRRIPEPIIDSYEVNGETCMSPLKIKTRLFVMLFIIGIIFSGMFYFYHLEAKSKAKESEQQKSQIHDPNLPWKRFDSPGASLRDD